MHFGIPSAPRLSALSTLLIMSQPSAFCGGALQPPETTGGAAGQ